METHVMFGARMGAYKTSENVLAQQVVDSPQEGILYLADRLFYLKNKDENDSMAIGNDEMYLLLTTLLDCEEYPAEELTVLYPERWEI